MRVRRSALVGLLATIALALASVPGFGAEPAQSTFHESFESAKTAWQQEETDALVNLLAHERSNRAAHDGLHSERFLFRAEVGSAFYYSFPLPKVPLSDDLKATLYVRSSRPGIQLLGRVVLPADTDPESGEPSFVMVQGTVSDEADRWRKLELTNLPIEAERQARVLRFASKRKVSLDGAYLERLVVNLYSGPGETEVFLDDLKLSPVADRVVAEAADLPPLPRISQPANEPGAPGGSTGIKIDGNRLTRDGHPWVPTIIRAPGADLNILQELGLDVLALDIGADPKIGREAARLGFRLMPQLDTSDRSDLRSAASRLDDLDAYPNKNSVAFWDLGNALGANQDKKVRKQELETVRTILRGLRDREDGTPGLATATAADEFRAYAQAGRNLDLTGVRPEGWGTSQEPFDTYNYLVQRRNLTSLDNLGGLLWAWVPAAAPSAFRIAVWGRDVPPPWGSPQVQPEQVRLYAYTALAAGYRGLAYEGDADLTRDPGKARRLEIALLQAEMDLIEPIIAEGADPIVLLPTFPPDPKPVVQFNTLGIAGGMNSTRQRDAKKAETPAHPTIKAAAITTKDGGRLLIVNDYAAGAQWQPPQMALYDLKIVTQVPESAQAWELTLGGLTFLESERLPGGKRISIPEFGGTSLILVTTDLALVERLKAQVRRIRSLAIPRAIEQGEAQIASVAEIHGMLARIGHNVLDKDDKPTNEAEVLLQTAKDSAFSARDALAREDYPVAWAEARRISRPLRILMRIHWDQARLDLEKTTKTALGVPDPLPSPDASIASRKRKDLPEVVVPPVGCPPLLAFNMLPSHYHWLSWIRDYPFSETQLPTGLFDEFDTTDDLIEDGWNLDEGFEYDRVVPKIEIEKGKGWNGNNSLKLTVGAKRKDIKGLPPFLDHPAVAVRTPPISVSDKQLVRIRVMVKMPRQTPTGAGGLIVRDSIGGEALQYRVSNSTPKWQEVVLYRRVPANGELTVLLGLAGFGEAYFDDLRIEWVED
ncbi:MAG: hypothetical protein ABI353_08455, partial [Isosphaeraceae bacterium]